MRTSISIRHPRAALAGSAALALAALLAGCADDLPTAVPPTTPPPGEVNIEEPAPRCEAYVEIARTYARHDGLSHICFTPQLRPDLWSADYPDPLRRQCSCSAYVD